MRKALLVLALIGSSFAGGAVVNGPGLQALKAWAQDQLADPAAQGLMGPVVEGGQNDWERDEFPSVPVPRITGADPGVQLTATETAAIEPAPTPETAPQPAPVAAPETAAIPALTPPAEARNSQSEPAAPPAPQEVEAPPLPSQEEAKAAAEPQPWGDAPDSKAPAQAVLPNKPASPTAQLANAAASEAAAAGSDQEVSRASAGSVSPAPSPRSSESPGRWNQIKDRLLTLGVTRFWVEGEPAGVVRFRCSIPLAGQSAVAQQFEAEGDDPLQAAETVLKRVALWQAAHGEP